MHVTQITLGRFHHFHLARQLQKHRLLNTVWTGYPRFQLKDEHGVPQDKIRTFPWIQTMLMGKGRLGIPDFGGIDRELFWLSPTLLDRYVSRRLKSPKALIALSGSGLQSGLVTQQAGGIYYCDRGSTHIRFQDRILREEYRRWDLAFAGVDPRTIDREEAEYELADYVSIPSRVVAKTFIEMGVAETKLVINPYGARLERFRQDGEPEKNVFTVIFVGGVSIRKGVLYLLDAFSRLKHPNKRLKIIGSVSDEIKPLLSRYGLTNVEFVGVVPNDQLVRHFSTAHVMVLPSIEEGFGMVLGEAMACGCPVIASQNTGASDFYTDGIEGFMVKAGSVDELLVRLEEMADNEPLRQTMSKAAIERVKTIGGWDAYGDRWVQQLGQHGVHS